MIQSRTHNCNELRIGNVGERVTLVGWFENMRKVSKNLGFVILRDFYGTTQLVVFTMHFPLKLISPRMQTRMPV